MSILGLINCF